MTRYIYYVYPGIDCQVTLEMRNSLHYTQAVLNEVMRLSPLSPMAFPHETLKDTTVGESALHLLA